MRPRGFTLIEIVIALAIVGALLGVLFGGLRLGIAAWRQGEARADVQQHARSLDQIFTETLAGTHPYRAGNAAAASRPAFDGDRDRLAVVTSTPPVPFARPIAFAAVAFTRDDRGLVIAQKPLPDRASFDGLTPTIVDATVAGLQFRYLRPGGGWESRWDGSQELVLPAAVEVTLASAEPGAPVGAPLIVLLHALVP